MAVVSAAAFGTLAILGKLGFDAGLASETLLQWRFGAAAVVLLALGRFRHRLTTRLRALLFASGLVYTAQTGFFFAALERITAGTTALLLYLAPVFIVLYSLLLRRRPTRGQLAAVAIGLAGLVVIVGLPSRADADAVGLAFAAAAGATFAAYALSAELLFRGIPPLVITAHSVAGAAVGFVVVDLARSGGLTLPAGAGQWAIVAGAVAVPTLVAIPLLFAAIGRIGAGPTAVISNTEPLFTLGLAAIFLGERVNAGQVVGGALILAGAVLAQRTAGRPGVGAGIVPNP